MSSAHPTSDAAVGAGEGQRLLERLGELPGGAQLIELAGRHGDVELVGGAVRDLILGVAPRELDVTVGADPLPFAHDLARALGGPPNEVAHHERFHTARVRAPSGEVDVAMRRRERYPSPGALPEVEAGSAEEDLERRDFTVNALALGLSGAARGRLRAPAHALEDLRERRLRVLHERSFLDDPTRILRMARYTARLGFEVESGTAQLAARAIAGGALRTVSGSRLGAELRLAFAEPSALAALAEMDRLGVLSAWEPGVCFDEHVVALALRIMPEDGSRAVLFAAALLLHLADRLGHEDTEARMRGFVFDLELPAGVGERVFGAAVSASVVIDSVDAANTTPELLELTDGTPVESLALAAAVRDLEDGPESYGRRVIEDWLREQRHVALQVTGDDLIAAGVPEGPEVGMRLEESYRLLLEERIEPGREAELRAALEAKL